MDRVGRMVGNFNQLQAARRITFRDGVSDGIRAIELRNRSGLYATCMEDQCLNLYDFSYRGINFSFQSKNGLVSNKFFNGGTSEFSYYWPAGMFYTCGLTNTGAAVLENGMYYAEHGRIGMMPAENVAVTHTDDAVVITGQIADVMLCGHHLRLSRTITFPYVGKQIRIQDCVSNMEGISTELMLLYHCNFGYPLLSPGARIVMGKGILINQIDGAPIPNDFGSITEPRDDKCEEVYCNTPVPNTDGYAYAGVINEDLKLGGYVKFKTDTLPYMIYWKNMCAHDYCIGLEPSVSFSQGRKEERENGTLPVLDPYETRVFEISIGVLDGNGEIEEFEKLCKN